MSCIRDFVPLLKLGEGSYSNVYKRIYALKKVKMNELTVKERENALTEIRILASLQSPHIIAYKEAFFDDKLSVLCIVMEFADGGDLLQIVEQHRKQKSHMKESAVWLAVANILKGLNALHSKGILHRDLKCANVFKSGNLFKLGDLNVSKVDKGRLAYTQTGTPYYASPEVWRDEPYGSKSDIWSLGCIIYEMVALKPPFAGNDLQELFKAVQNKPTPRIPDNYSRDLNDLVALCLQKKISFRPTAQELWNHPVFSTIFQSYMNCIEEAPTSSKKEALLQTIKLPTDLRQLKQNLPCSKYDTKNGNEKAKDKDSHRVQNSSSLHCLRKIQLNIKKNESLRIELPAKKDLRVNQSQIYLSPSSRNNSDLTRNIKSPSSDLKDRVGYVYQKYSDRLHVSDRKMPAQIDRNYLNSNLSDKNIIPRPLPRADKARKPLIGNYDHYVDELQELRKKLMKKNRVLSSNVNRGYWAS